MPRGRGSETAYKKGFNDARAGLPMRLGSVPIILRAEYRSGYQDGSLGSKK